ncbi:hypothetical protein [Pseudomonas gingeri]|uniref:Uncharacterized protein n=1 Tax=Pseudomonas gingeri TaxID=117681 RepID=A0A7Y8CC19_9PSED|nr:hypothetical protein [Pseudomonas gingeri]NWC12431.1 hypothetical protein [Pseudomonas gingeri]
MTHAQDTTQAQAALLRNDSGIAAPVTDSCCEAASIIDPLSTTTEGLVPHEKLREAATPKASLIALDRPPAQPAKGYTHPASIAGSRAGGPRYWPADLTDVRPEEWAQMSPRHVAEFAGKTEVWLLLEAAQQHIAELTEQIAAQGLDKQLLQAKVDALQSRMDHADQVIDDLAAETRGLRVSSLREAMERAAAARKPCALIVGDTRVQVSYHGIKWYHDLQKPGQVSQSLTIEEFDLILERDLAIAVPSAQRDTVMAQAVKEKMVSVPRERLNSATLLQIPIDELQEQAIELLCEPCDEPAEQHQDGPAAYLVTDVHDQKKALRAGAEGIERHRNAGSTLIALYAHLESGEIDKLREQLKQKTEALDTAKEMLLGHVDRFRKANEKLAERDALIDRLRNHLTEKGVLGELGPEPFQILNIETPERATQTKAVKP